MTFIVCERCGDGVTVQDGDPNLSDWGAVRATTLLEVPIVGTDSGPADICPSCIDELLRWFRGDLVLMPPAPPSTPAPPPLERKTSRS